MTPLDVALTLGACLDRARIPYAIGGALALSYWAVPRATADSRTGIGTSRRQCATS